MDMNFAELSAQRYSLRKFSDRPVEDALQLFEELVSELEELL